MHVPRAADLRRPRLHRRARHGAVRARRAHHDALRRHDADPGARSARAQGAAAAGRGTEAFPARDQRVLRNARGRRRARRVHRSACASRRRNGAISRWKSRSARRRIRTRWARRRTIICSIRGYVALAYFWARSVVAASTKSEAGVRDSKLHDRSFLLCAHSAACSHARGRDSGGRFELARYAGRCVRLSGVSAVSRRFTQ